MVVFVLIFDDLVVESEDYCSAASHVMGPTPPTDFGALGIVLQELVTSKGDNPGPSRRGCEECTWKRHKF
jgi:hypothetical protein